MRPVVFDWENHSHVLESVEVERQSGYRDARNGQVCVICSTAAEQHVLGSDDLGRHPESCRCRGCVADPREVARQRAVIKAEKEKIPF
jgi:hypothetical protein